MLDFLLQLRVLLCLVWPSQLGEPLWRKASLLIVILQCFEMSVWEGAYPQGILLILYPLFQNMWKVPELNWELRFSVPCRPSSPSKAAGKQFPEFSWECPVNQPTFLFLRSSVLLPVFWANPLPLLFRVRLILLICEGSICHCYWEHIIG